MDHTSDESAHGESQLEEAERKVREYTKKVEDDIREHFEKRGKEDHESAMKARDNQPPLAEMEVVERQGAQIPGIFGDNQTAADIGYPPYQSGAIYPYTMRGKPAPSPNDVANAGVVGGGYASAEDARQSAVVTQGPSSSDLNAEARAEAATNEGGMPAAGPMDVAVNHPDVVDRDVNVGDSQEGDTGFVAKLEDMVGGHSLGSKTAAEDRKDTEKQDEAEAHKIDAQK